jgi:hypothetical protein
MQPQDLMKADRFSEILLIGSALIFVLLLLIIAAGLMRF